jgi:phosphatidylglycerol---prolipoprotein diacylglyceryl transferase
VSAVLVIPWFAFRPIEVGPIPIAPFDLLALGGAAIFWWIARRFALANGVSRYDTIDLGIHAVGFGLLAAPFLNAAFYEPRWFVEVWSAPSFPGLSSYGGFIGAVLGLAVWRLRRGVDWLAPADALAFAFPFAWIPCRLSCFFAHDHPGVPSRFFLAVDDYYELGVARHDLGLYEAIWAVFAAVLFSGLSRTKRAPGFYLAALLLLYSSARFALDFLRAGPDFPHGDARYAGLTPGHYASAVFFALGLVIVFRIRARTRA